MIRKLLIAFFILISSFAQAQEPLTLSDKIATETSAYYLSHGVKRKAEVFKPFANSSIRVAKMFPMYPAVDTTDRAIRLYCKGGKESMFKKNYINVNIPGMKYSSGKVKYFSLDYDWVGLNEINVVHTYAIAKAIQENRRLPKRSGNRDFRELLAEVNIPEHITLYKIDLLCAHKARKEWISYKRLGYTPRQMYDLIEVEYESRTRDQLDSALIYRLIVDLERYTLNWEYEYMDEGLYKWLTQRIR